MAEYDEIDEIDDEDLALEELGFEDLEDDDEPAPEVIAADLRLEPEERELVASDGDEFADE